MSDEARGSTVVEAERWFELNGLPYFVGSNERAVREALSLSRLVPVLAVAVVLAAAAGTGIGVATGDVSAAVLVGALAGGVVLLGYAFVSLHLRPIARWAAAQTFGSLGWLFPLVTRALPLLLLFITFLFINTEVWQVATSLQRELLWLTVLLFAGVAVAFLLVRLPEEVRAISADAEGDRDRLVGNCAGTPVAEAAVEVAAGDRAGHTDLSRLQGANLVLVLLFAQALQVLLLSLSVFAFFIGFGKLVIRDSVIRSWLADPDAPHHLPSLGWLPVSDELFQVSVFLAAFSGLYFTVYAVTDENYRKQFFTSIAADVERALCVRTVYLALLARS